MAARLTVLSGPSGVGKGTVVRELRRLAPDVWVSVSCTTRAPRPGEQDGEAYWFVTRERFEQLVVAGEMLEWAQFAGNFYGTPRQPVEQHLEAGIPTLLEIELDGARQVRRAMPDARFVFLAPPSLDELVNRLNLRGTESADELRARLDRARIELEASSEFDTVVVNSEVGQAAVDVAGVVR